jgi:type II secretory ATPase GspE/PulE/Tfp pilus assembly ATPase PilB-like protein
MTSVPLSLRPHVLHAIRIGAQRVSFSPYDDGSGRASVAFVVDGERFSGGDEVAPELERAHADLRVVCDLDAGGDRNQPWSGGFIASVGDTVVSIRVDAVPGVRGPLISLYLVPIGDANTQHTTLLELGLSLAERDALLSACQPPHRGGLIVLSGPTWSGKNPVAYAMMNELPAARSKGTIEVETRGHLRGVHQSLIDENLGITPSTLLRAMGSVGVEVVYLREVFGYDEVDTALRLADRVGMTVITTIHTTSAAATPIRLMNMGIDPFRVYESCHLFQAQRRLPRLCVECRSPMRDADRAAFASALPLPQREAVLSAERPHSAVGCPACRWTGRKGTFLIFEQVPSLRKLRLLDVNDVTTETIAAAAAEAGLPTMRSRAIEAFGAGLVDAAAVLSETVDG